MILWQNSVRRLDFLCRVIYVTILFLFLSGDKHTVEIHIHFLLGKTKEHLLSIPQGYEVKT